MVQLPVSVEKASMNGHSPESIAKFLNLQDLSFIRLRIVAEANGQNIPSAYDVAFLVKTSEIKALYLQERTYDGQLAFGEEGILCVPFAENETAGILLFTIDNNEKSAGYGKVRQLFWHEDKEMFEYFSQFIEERQTSNALSVIDRTQMECAGFSGEKVTIRSIVESMLRKCNPVYKN